MKQVVSILSFFCSLCTYAQCGLGVFGGINFSSSSTAESSVEKGGSIGLFYDTKLNHSWFIQPRLMASYQQNTIKNTLGSDDNEISQWCAAGLLIASHRWAFGDAFAFRLGFGPYMQYVISGERTSHAVIYNADASHSSITVLNEKWSFLSDKEQFTWGLAASIAFEYRRWVLMLDARHSLQKRMVNWRGYELTTNISLGFKI